MLTHLPFDFAVLVIAAKFVHVAVVGACSSSPTAGRGEARDTTQMARIARAHPANWATANRSPTSRIRVGKRHDRSQRGAHGESGVEGGTVSLGTLRAARRGDLAADHHPGRGRPHLGHPRQELPGRVGRAVRGAGRARPRRTRRGCRQAGARYRVLPGVVVCHPARRSNSPSASPATLPPTSTGSSSRPAVARRSKARGSWPSSTSSSRASPASTR